MDQLIQLYADLIRGATDEQLPLHLNNLVTDAIAVAEAVKNVVDQARARLTAPPAP